MDNNTNDDDGSLDSGDDCECEGELPSIIPASVASTSGSSFSNRNALAFTKQYATHKHLCPSQITEVEAFAGDSVATHQIKLFTLTLALDNKLKHIVTTRPDFKVSQALEKNIHQLALGILTSSRLSSYKGSLPIKHLLNILIKTRFDLPDGIEFISSDWALVRSHVEYHLTQVCAAFKHFLKASLLDGPRTSHVNIFALGQCFVRDTNTVLTVELCSRITLMRDIFC
ncbi:hypothetical protein B0H10DRAFT_2439100 [Mycena sp. CBHHK59/15]|nr:hypothetical protein B0H10DRAFT_2439100 [Mycena sp. CBHHK59/15]